MRFQTKQLQKIIKKPCYPFGAAKPQILTGLFDLKEYFMEYKITQEQLNNLLDACKPTPCVSLDMGKTMLFGDQQDNANRAWEKLGAELNFDHWTVKPISGKNQRFFTANEKEQQWNN